MKPFLWRQTFAWPHLTEAIVRLFTLGHKGSGLALWTAVKYVQAKHRQDRHGQEQA